MRGLSESDRLPAIGGGGGAGVGDEGTWNDFLETPRGDKPFRDELNGESIIGGRSGGALDPARLLLACLCPRWSTGENTSFFWRGEGEHWGATGVVPFEEYLTGFLLC